MRLEADYGAQAREIAAQLAVHFERAGDTVQAAQGSILIGKQQPGAGAIALGADGPQTGEERPEHASVLEALEGLLRYRKRVW